jgi:ribosomal protein S18 acetylase RimI-like enzyme
MGEQVNRCARQCLSSPRPGNDVPDLLAIRRLAKPDLAAYKALRDEMLAAHPEAFTSDAATERERSADSYCSRLGIDRADGGQFTLGAWQGQRLVGALGCERDLRVKVRHVAHLIGMMVRTEARQAGIGHALLLNGIAAARSAEGVTIMTLSVTAGNAAAIHLYERAGFRRYGSLVGAICVDGVPHAKDHMVLTL